MTEMKPDQPVASKAAGDCPQRTFQAGACVHVIVGIAWSKAMFGLGFGECLHRPSG